MHRRSICPGGLDSHPDRLVAGHQTATENKEIHDGADPMKNIEWWDIPRNCGNFTYTVCECHWAVRTTGLIQMKEMFGSAMSSNPRAVCGTVYVFAVVEIQKDNLSLFW